MNTPVEPSPAQTDRTAAIETRDLVKRYGAVTAVAGLTFRVEPGSVTALLGGNGAGKTTTIAMILGLVTPTSGDIRVLGEDAIRHLDRVLPRMNFESPYVDLPHRLTVEQNLLIYARLYGLSDARERVRAVCADLDLTDFLSRPAGQLSAGQKTRVALAKALINEPDLLLLDEPTASLDPDTADWVRTYLETYRARKNATILLASHNMAEVERLCDHVMMMRGGAIVDADPPDVLVRRYGRQNLEQVFLDIARGTKSTDPDSGTKAAE